MRRLFQFSLTSMLIFTVLVALGFRYYTPQEIEVTADQAKQYGVVDNSFKCASIQFVIQRSFPNQVKRVGPVILRNPSVMNCLVPTTSGFAASANGHFLYAGIVTPNYSQCQVKTIKSIIFDSDAEGKPNYNFVMLTDEGEILTAGFHYECGMEMMEIRQSKDFIIQGYELGAKSYDEKTANPDERLSSQCKLAVDAELQRIQSISKK